MTRLGTFTVFATHDHGAATPAMHLRRQAVDAVALEKQLEQRLQSATALADRLEELAVLALPEGRDRVRTLLDQRVGVLKQAECLAERLQAATAASSQMKAGLRQRGPGSPALFTKRE